MTLFRSSRYARGLALMLISALYLLPAACTSAAAAAQSAVAKQTILVFPFEISTDKSGQALPENMGADFANAVKSSLSGDRNLIAIAFSDRLTSVQRAVIDGSLKKEDVAGPFGPDKDQRDRALRVAGATASDLALIGSIDEYAFDAAKKQFTVTVTAELINVKSGKTVKLSTVTGRSAEGAKETDPDALASLAAGDAVTKVAAEITPAALPVQVTAPGAPQPAKVAIYDQPKKKSWFKKLLVPIVLGVAVGIAASSGGSSSSSGSGGGPDGPPNL